MVDRTTLSQDSVAELLEMCLRSTYFSSGGNFNEHAEGIKVQQWDPRFLPGWPTIHGVLQGCGTGDSAI